MLAVDRRRVDPGNLRQPAFLDVAAEGVEVFLGFGAGQGVGHAFVQWVGGVVGGRIVGVVRQRLAGVGIGRARSSAAGYREARRQVGLAELLERAQHVVAPFVRHVLVADPADAGRFQSLGVGRPGVAGVGRGGQAVDRVPLIVDEGDVGGGGAVGAGQVERTVRVRARMHRAVVRVAQRKGIGQRELERDLLLLEVAHRRIGLVRRPVGHAAVVPGLLTVHPGMRRAGRALRVVVGAIQVIRGQHGAVGALLLPYLARIGQRDGEAVAEPAHALERAEVVVEGTVLLHQDHHMLDILDGAGGIVGRDGQGLADAGRERGQRGGGEAGASCGLQEVAARDHGLVGLRRDLRYQGAQRITGSGRLSGFLPGCSGCAFGVAVAVGDRLPPPSSPPHAVSNAAAIRVAARVLGSLQGSIGFAWLGWCGGCWEPEPGECRKAG
ncbi:hypothetical protein D9M72_264070 [compost metagenome]